MRFTRVRACVWLVAVVTALPCVRAQDGKAPPAGARPSTSAAQRARRGAAARDRRFRRAVRGMDPARLQQEMNAQLQLTSEQKDRIAARLRAYGAALKEARARQREHLVAVQGRRNEITEKIKAAREAKDHEAVRAAVMELRELFNAGADLRGLQEQLIRDLTEIVPTDQRGAFEEIVRRLQSERSRRGLLARIAPNRLVPTAQAAKLPEEKVAALKQLVDAYNQDRKGADQSDRRGRSRRLAKFRKDVLATLTPKEQDALVAASRRGPRRAGRPPRLQKPQK